MGLGVATGVKCSGNAPLTITYLGTNPVGLPIGPARPDRILVAIGYSENDSPGGISSVTFNGAAGTIIDSPNMSDTFSMSYKELPSGTSCDVSMVQYGLVRLEFYLITGIKTGYHGKANGIPATNAMPSQPAAVIYGARASNAVGGFGAYATGGVLSFQLDHGFNHSGGGNISVWAASGYGDSSGANFDSYVTGGATYGCAAVFK